MDPGKRTEHPCDHITDGINSTVTSMVPGVYVFRWTISSGTCPTSESTVTITNYATPTTSTTGADQTICGLTSTSLGGNTPVNGTGAWSQTSGPGTTTFSASGTGSSTATATLYGTYTYTWTISNGVCAPSTSEIEVTYYQTPTAATAAEHRTSAAPLRAEPWWQHSVVGTGPGALSVARNL
ncbi:MAG: hypothetical protein IPF68_19730 [Bacteroidales bacterium]|nr:hypothetical protein [Bacteroidales bacterium]